MKAFSVKHRTWLIFIGLLLVAAAIVWAVTSGQANAKAADAGSKSADVEMMSLNTIKNPEKTKNSPEPPPCDWQAERRIKKAIDANDADYKTLREKAQTERTNQGKVSDDTKTKVLASSQDFNKLCEEYAEMWAACNCKTRAQLARDAGASRLQSAEVLIEDEINDDQLEEMDEAQEKMKESRREYVNEAVENDELSDEDKQEIKNEVVPQTKTMVTDLTGFVQDVMQLLKEVQSEVKGASGGGAFSALKKIGKSDGGGLNLVSSVKTLVGVAKNLLSNSKALLTDAQALSGDKPSGEMTEGPGEGKKPGGFCFIESAAAFK